MHADRSAGSSLSSFAINLAYGNSYLPPFARRIFRSECFASTGQPDGFTTATIGAIEVSAAFSSFVQFLVDRMPTSSNNSPATRFAEAFLVFPPADAKMLVARREAIASHFSSKNAAWRLPGKLRCMSQPASFRSVCAALR